MDEEKPSLGALRSAIERKGAKWQPSITTMSQITATERKIRLGLQPTSIQLQLITKLSVDKPSTRIRSNENFTSMSNPGPAGLASKHDWRDENGVDWTTPIKDQGGCGSCVAFGTLASLEAMLKIRTYKDNNKTIDLSEAHLFYCNDRECLPGDPNSGWSMSPACDYLKNNGVPDDACFPYTDHNQPCNTCSDWKSRIGYTKIPSWSHTMDVNKMKDNIVKNGPQITGMAVYEDFWDYESGVYEYVNGGLEGYHCVSVVGFDDTNECWICKNSWGTGWGENGWFKIKYRECGIDDVFGMWNLVAPSNDGDDGICFIATAAFGSELDPHVQFLRNFRDDVVLKSIFKNTFKWLLRQYYKFSPPIARKMKVNSLLKNTIKYSVVYPFVLCTKGVALLALTIQKIKKITLGQSRPHR